jgi:hypothetical protein
VSMTTSHLKIGVEPTSETSFILNIRGISFSIVTRLRAGRPGFDSWQGQ